MLQRWAFSGKLGFRKIFGGPRGDPQKKKTAMTKKFFLLPNDFLEPPKGSGCRSVPPPPSGVRPSLPKLFNFAEESKKKTHYSKGKKTYGGKNAN